VTGWTLLSAILLAFWALLSLDRKRAWPGSLMLDSGSRRRPPPGARVAVLVPARNEAELIGETLPSLLRQGGSYSRLTVIDDRSTDGTGEVVSRLAAASPFSPRLRVVTPEPTPRGWSGKLHALQSGLDSLASDQEGATAGWLLFTDADIGHPEGSIDALLGKAEEGPFDLVSVMARLRAEASWEKLLVPPFVYFFQLLYPFRRVSERRSRVAAAAGGCVLLRREMLRAIGGLEAIRDATIDDVALARAVKRKGGRCWLGLHPEVVSVRPYRGLRGIVEMVARSAFTQLRFRYSLLLATLLSLCLFFVSPPILLVGGILAGDTVAWGAATMAWGLQAASLLPTVRYHRVAAAFAVSLPLASALYGYMTVLSAWRHLRGRGSLWKGRPVG
jgi:hopene-associated glycosyltransferase HpnB